MEPEARNLNLKELEQLYIKKIANPPIKKPTSPNFWASAEPPSGKRRKHHK
jgi:hypothetical protein